MIITDRVLRTWKITFPDGCERLIEGHHFMPSKECDGYVITRADSQGYARTIFAINPAPGTLIEDVTETP